MEKFYHLLFACHRIPERSFFFRGQQFPICARCTGILIGYLCGIIYALVYGAIPLAIAIILLVPLVIDGSFQYLGKWESTNWRRLITGIIAGIGTDFILFGILSLGFNHGKQLMQHLLLFF